MTFFLRFDGTLALNETRLGPDATKVTLFLIFLRARKLTLLAICSPTKEVSKFQLGTFKFKNNIEGVSLSENSDTTQMIRS